MVSAKRIGTFLAIVFQGFPNKRQQTLAVLVAPLGSVGKVGIPRWVRPSARERFKHKIEQVDRFLGSGKVQVSEWCQALMATLTGERRSIRIAIDWTKVGPYPVLVASVVVQRRGIPVYWATWVYRRISQPERPREVVPDGTSHDGPEGDEGHAPRPRKAPWPFSSR